MNRIKSKVVFKNALKSPSPDKHTSNKIVRTNSPAQEVAQAKKNIIKKHNNNNNNNISNSNNNSNV